MCHMIGDVAYIQLAYQTMVVVLQRVGHSDTMNNFLHTSQLLKYAKAYLVKI